MHRSLENITVALSPTIQTASSLGDVNEVRGYEYRVIFDREIDGPPSDDCWYLSTHRTLAAAKQYAKSHAVDKLGMPCDGEMDWLPPASGGYLCASFVPDPEGFVWYYAIIKGRAR